MLYLFLLLDPHVKFNMDSPSVSQKLYIVSDFQEYQCLWAINEIFVFFGPCKSFIEIGQCCSSLFNKYIIELSFTVISYYWKLVSYSFKFIKTLKYFKNIFVNQ